MRLPDALFEAFIGCESLHLDRSRSSERRKQGRVRVPHRVHAIPMVRSKAGKPMNVQVRDMSHEGIGLLLPRKMLVGENLLIRLKCAAVTMWVLCDIARVEKVAEGLWVIGAVYNRFVSPLSRETTEIDENAPMISF